LAKTPLFQLHPLFSKKKKSVASLLQCLPVAIKGRRRPPSTQRSLLSRGVLLVPPLPLRQPPPHLSDRKGDTTSSISDFKEKNDPLTYWTRCFQSDCHKKPDASGKELIEIFSTFLADIQKDYTQRCDTITAHIVRLAKGNKEVASEINHLAKEVSNFMEEAQDEFITKVDFHQSLDPLESDMMSV
jgi:hypothetical protein